MTAPQSVSTMSHTADFERMVDEAFRRIPHLPAGSIDWELSGRTLVIRGRVGTFHIKQLTQSAALRLPGIERVINEIEVEPRGPASRRRRTDSH